MKDKMNKWVEKARTAIRWVAVNSRGEVYGFSDKPEIKNGIEWTWNPCSTKSIFLGIMEGKKPIKNWDKSLRKVSYE